MVRPPWQAVHLLPRLSRYDPWVCGRVSASSSFLSALPHSVYDSTQPQISERSLKYN